MGMIFDIKEMAVHDGPGIRTTVFFKGCPLRCLWCHNPEGLTAQKQLMVKENACRHCDLCRKGCSHPECQPFGRCLHICPENCLSVSGEEISPDALAERLLKSAQTLPDIFGGFTFSGGEPLAQPEFLMQLCDRLAGYDRCIETSGYAEPEVFLRVLSGLDRVIFDIKVADDTLHRQYTGVSNQNIFINFKAAKNSGKPLTVRTPLIPGLTDSRENLSAIRKLIGDTPWEQLPYNEMAGAKYKMLGMTYPLNK